MNSIFYTPKAFSQSTLNLPSPGTMVSTSSIFTPCLLKGIVVYPNEPLKFDFIIDSGDSELQSKEFQKETNRLIKYFLASLTIPEDEMWVNLSPYESKRIIPDNFGKTEMGIALLEQDYILKQLTASLMYPENDLGNEFWNRVYSKAQEKFGTTEIPMNTFNKIWIVPEKAVLYINGTSVFVVENHLKVMLEEDYLALEQNKNKINDEQDDLDVFSGIQSAIVRDILIPEIEKEVNTGKNFANLRQIFNSLILATWYKQHLKKSILGSTYIDKGRVIGVNVDDDTIVQGIYDQYVVAFKEGVFNYIKEYYEPETQEVIPRKYFSGGVDAKEVGRKMTPTGTAELFEKSVRGDLFTAQVFLRSAHDLYHEAGGFKTVLENIASEIGASTADGRIDLLGAVRAQGGTINLKDGGVLRLEEDGILVIIDSRFNKSHAGRGTYQLAAYAETPEKANHELAELRNLIKEARSLDILKPDDSNDMLGQRIKEWSNGTNEIGITENELLRRQNLIIQMLDNSHREGLIAEGKISEAANYELTHPLSKPNQNFDFTVASEGLTGRVLFEHLMALQESNKMTELARTLKLIGSVITNNKDLLRTPGVMPEKMNRETLKRLGEFSLSGIDEFISSAGLSAEKRDTYLQIKRSLEQLSRPSGVVQQDNSRSSFQIGGNKTGGKIDKDFSGDVWIEAGRFSYKIWVQGNSVYFQRFDRQDGEALGNSRQIPMGTKFQVGREQGDYTIADDKLSQKHFSFQVKKSSNPEKLTLEIEDLGSSNGTKINIAVSSAQTESAPVLSTQRTLADILSDVNETGLANQVILEALDNLEPQTIDNKSVDILIAGLKGNHGMAAFLIGRVGLVTTILKLIGFLGVDKQYLSEANAQKLLDALKDFYGLNGQDKADPQLKEILSTGYDFRETIPQIENSLKSLWRKNDSQKILRDRFDGLQKLRNKFIQGELPEIVNKGDLHGRPEDLERILKDFREATRNGRAKKLIIHGDGFDRGPGNVRIFEIFKELKQLAEQNENISVEFLWGNHDAWLIQALILNDQDALKMWLKNGGQMVLDQFKKAGLDINELAFFMLENFKLFHVDEWGFMHLHAGVPVDQEGNPALNRSKLDQLQAELETMQKEIQVKGRVFFNNPENKNRFAQFLNEAAPFFWVRKNNWIKKFVKEPQINIDETNQLRLFVLLEKVINDQIRREGGSISAQDIRNLVEKNWKEMLLSNEALFRQTGIVFTVENREPQVDKVKLDKFLARMGVNGIIIGHDHHQQLLNIDNRIFGIDVDDQDVGHLIINLSGVQFDGIARSGNDIILDSKAVLENLDSQLDRMAEQIEDERPVVTETPAERESSKSLVAGRPAESRFNEEVQVTKAKMNQHKLGLRVVWGDGSIELKARRSTSLPGAISIQDFRIGQQKIAGILVGNSKDGYVLGERLLIREGDNLNIGRDAEGYVFLTEGRRFYVGQYQERFVLIQSDETGIPESFITSRVITNGPDRVSVRTQPGASSSTKIEPYLDVSTQAEALEVLQGIFNRQDYNQGPVDDYETSEPMDLESIQKAVKLPTIKSRIDQAHKRFMALDFEKIAPFALRTVSQKYYKTDPNNPFGINPSYPNQLFLIGINPESFLFNKSWKEKHIFPTDLTAAQRNEIQREFLFRLFNTITARLNFGDDGLISAQDLEKSPVFQVFRGFDFPNVNQEGESPLTSVDFSSAERALHLSSDDTYKDWYSQASVNPDLVKPENEVFTAKLTQLELEAIEQEIEQYLDGPVKDYVSKLNSLWNNEVKQTYKRTLMKRYVPYYLYGKFIDWLVESSEKEPGQEKSNVGGIDLNPTNLNLEIQGENINFEFPLNFNPIQLLPVDGYLPVIIDIIPVTNLPYLLGNSTVPDDQILSKLSY